MYMSLKIKTMSNNKQSSLDYYITKLTEILGPEIIKQISRDDNERIARLEKQVKVMQKEEIIKSMSIAFIDGAKIGAINYESPFTDWEQYYNEAYGGNDE